MTFTSQPGPSDGALVLIVAISASLIAARPALADCNWIDGSWQGRTLAATGCAAAYADIDVKSGDNIKCNATGTVYYNNQKHDVCGTLVNVYNSNFTLRADLSAPGDRDPFKGAYPSQNGACEIEVEVTTDNKMCALRFQLQRKH